MRNMALAVLSAFAVALAAPAGAIAEEGPHGAAEDRHAESGTMAMGQDATAEEHNRVACTAPVHVTEAAERKLGGALYEGPLPKAATQMGKMRMGAMPATNVALTDKAVPGMEGSHGVHKGLRGGEFIMVPNQLHHMEVVYSLDCGVQLFMYNAFTAPIRADRFQGFILILPEGGDEFFEVMRFLIPSEDGSYLYTPIAHDHDNPKSPRGMFEVELYLKFPEDIHPRKFDLIVGTEAH